MTLNARPDRKLIRKAGNSRRHVLLSLEAPLAPNRSERLPVNIALVIDRSGSMSGEPLASACEAAAYVLRQLGPKDRFSVVTFEDEVDVVVAATAATPRAVASAVAAIERIHIGGCTDLGAGWLTGCGQVADHLDREAVNRAFLLTDGLANRGITGHDALCEHARELRARGISTSTFGLGPHFDEVLLAGMAEAGGGNFHFIEHSEMIPSVFRQELGEGLEIVAPEARLCVTVPAGVHVTSLNRYPLRAGEAAGEYVLDLGDLGSGQLLEPVLELRFPGGEAGSFVQTSFSLSDRKAALPTTPCSLAFEYAGHRANDAQARDRDIDRRVAALYAGQARREALALNRDGAFDKARERLRRTRKRIEQYVMEDAVLDSLVGELQSTEAQYAVDLDPMARKAAYFAASATVKERTHRGAARKRAGRRSVVVLPSSLATRACARAAVSALAPVAPSLLGHLAVGEPRSTLAVEDERGRLTPRQEIEIADTTAGLLPHEGVRMTTTHAQLSDNWYSHWDAGGRTALVSVFAFEDLVQVAMEAYLAYEIVLNGLNNASPRYDLHAIAHEETRGCLFDFCGDKREMEIKLQTMDLCPQCRRHLAGIGIDVDAVLRLTDVVRRLAVPMAAPA